MQCLSGLLEVKVSQLPSSHGTCSYKCHENVVRVPHSIAAGIDTATAGVFTMKCLNTDVACVLVTMCSGFTVLVTL